jgi:RNA-binding protein 5/10
LAGETIVLILVLQIADCVKVFGPVDDVRLIRNKVTGESRGFAFIDFFSVEDATRFLELNHRVLEIDGQSVGLSYSSTKPLPINSDNKRQDWICPHCNYKNFARRVTCLNCSKDKPDDAVLCPSDNYRQQSNVLLVRGLHPNTTRETLVNVFAQFQRQLQDVRLIKDKNTGLSRGFCFVEFYSVPDAAFVLHSAGAQFYVDNQQVSLTFADTSPGAGRRAGRNRSDDRPEGYDSVLGEEYMLDSLAEGSDSFNPDVSHHQQLLPPNPPPNAYWKYDEQSGYFYDNMSGYYYDYNSGYYFDPTSQNYYQYDHNLMMFVLPGDSAHGNVTLERRQAAVPNNDYDVDNIVPAVPSEEPVSDLSTNALPPSTTATNPPLQKKKKKVTTVLSAPTTVPILPPEKEKKVTAPSAKVASDISRWSRKNQELKEEPRKLDESPTEPVAVNNITAPVNTNVPTLAVVISEPTPVVSTNEQQSSHPESVHSEKESSSSEESEKEPVPSKELLTLEQEIELALGPLTKGTVCLLCKRWFTTDVKLERHCQLSDLHKTNLQQRKLEIRAELEPKYPIVPPQPKKPHKKRKLVSYNNNPISGDSHLPQIPILTASTLPNAVPSPPSTQTPLLSQDIHQSESVMSNPTALAMMGLAPNENTEEQENSISTSIGAKMMAAMGWKGGGLGKEETGRIEPVEVQIFTDKMGLGSLPEIHDDKFLVLPGDSYQQATKKRMQERFNRISK